MALRIDKGNIGEIWREGRRIAAIWSVGKIVWEAINSCFGKGFWQNNKPWRNEDGWRN